MMQAQNYISPSILEELPFDDPLFAEVGDLSFLANADNGDFDFQTTTDQIPPAAEQTNWIPDGFIDPALLAASNPAPSINTSSVEAPNFGQQYESILPPPQTDTWDFDFQGPNSQQNGTWEFMDLNSQQYMPTLDQPAIPEMFDSMGSSTLSQQCTDCFAEAYHADPSANGTNMPAICPHANHRLAVHNDSSGAFSASRYPDPQQMAQMTVPPYGSYNSGEFRFNTQLPYAQRPRPLTISTNTASSTAGRSTASPSTVAESSGAAPGAPKARKRQRKRRQSSSEASTVSPNRKTKRQKRTHTDPENVYWDEIDVPEPWGPDGLPSLFTYNRSGRLMDGRKYNSSQIRTFIDQNPRPLTLWVQNYPAQCKSRLPNQVLECMWECCPAPSHKITAGWLQVAFDEFPTKTTDGTRDPFKVAAWMHLWCFEQCCDLVHDYQAGTLRPENRHFEMESKINPMRLERDGADVNLIKDTFHGWFEKNAWHPGKPPRTTPRPHKETLSYAMISHHLKHQTKSRAKARNNRNQYKDPSEQRTIDIHRGNLEFWARARFSKHVPYMTPGFVSGGPNGFQSYQVASMGLGISAYGTSPVNGQGGIASGYGNQSPWFQGINNGQVQQSNISHVGSTAGYTSASPAFNAPALPQAPKPSQKRKRDDSGEPELEATQGSGSAKRRRTSEAPQPARRSARLTGAQPTLALPQPSLALPRSPASNPNQHS